MQACIEVRISKLRSEGKVALTGYSVMKSQHLPWIAHDGSSIVFGLQCTERLSIQGRALFRAVDVPRGRAENKLCRLQGLQYMSKYTHPPPCTTVILLRCGLIGGQSVCARDDLISRA